MDIAHCGCSRDHGPMPYTADVTRAAIENTNFRTAFWTGKHAQMTLMSIPVCSDIGMEIHKDTDQIIRIEQGNARVVMGKNCNRPDLEQQLHCGDTVFVLAGTWHNIINVGRTPLKVSSIYAPPHHKAGTVHRTKEDAERKY